MMVRGTSQRRRRFADGHFSTKSRLADGTYSVPKTLRTAWTFCGNLQASASSAIQHPAAKRLDSGSTYLLRVLQLAIRLFHRPLVSLLERFWRDNPADLLYFRHSAFQPQICESWTKAYPARPFVTIITDLADFPPRFWIEADQRAIRHCGH